MKFSTRIEGLAEFQRDIRAGVAKYRSAQRGLMREAVKVVRTAAVQELRATGLKFQPGRIKPQNPRETAPAWRRYGASPAQHVASRVTGSAKAEVEGSVRASKAGFYLAFHEKGYEIRHRVGAQYLVKRGSRKGRISRSLSGTGSVPARPWLTKAYEATKEQAAGIIGSGFDVLIGRL